MRKNNPARSYETKRIIEILKTYPGSGLPRQQIYSVLKRLLDGVPMHAHNITNTELYRARWHNSGALFESASQLLYPPPAVVVSKGRFNDVGESVLYAALCEMGTLVELKPKLNKFFVISTLRRRSTSELMFIPIGFFADFYPSYVNSNQRLVVEFLNFIASRVVVDDAYDLSIALAKFLYDEVRGDWQEMAFAYPSVESKLISNRVTYNVAMLPAVYHNNYLLDSVSLCALVRAGDNYVLAKVNIGFVDGNGAVRWKFSREETQERVSRGLLEGGEYCSAVVGLEDHI